MIGSVITVDVLVIGGGQAALRAAIEARRQGAKVAVVSKGRVGAGGSSALSDTVHSAVMAPGDSPEVFYRDILKGGKQINNPVLARALAEDCTERVRELTGEFGVELQWDEELITPGHSRPRRLYHRRGEGFVITRRLRDHAEAFGVLFCENTRVVDLLTDEGWEDSDRPAGFEWRGTDPSDPLTVGKERSGGKRIRGAVGWSKGRWVAYAAGSTILATGGVGRLYAHSDNPMDVTGEALGMAWRHGACLQDMEFVQFYPYRLVSPINIDLYTKLFQKGAVMRNGRGIRFLQDYPRKELETRDIVCYEMFKQGKVFLDVSRVSGKDLAETNPRLHALLAKGYRGELIMSPVEHYSMGGISIDSRGRTNLSGLFACGECTGGVHGANRLGGGALTEALVFGARAGRTAAEEAEAPTEHFVQKVEGQLTAGCGRMNPEEMERRGREIRKRIQAILWSEVGIERTAEGLRKATEQLDAMAEEVEFRPPLADLLQVARMIAHCARLRQESRGAHRVVEYPHQKREWQGNLVVQGESVTFHPRPGLEDERVS